jgi:hypothetical protein
MNRIKIHCLAFAILMPCIMAFSEGSLVINVVGLAYILVLFRLSSTTRGRRFIRTYYREILRLENKMK